MGLIDMVWLAAFLIVLFLLPLAFIAICGVIFGPFIMLDIALGSGASKAASDADWFKPATFWKWFFLLSFVLPTVLTILAVIEKGGI